MDKACQRPLRSAYDAGINPAAKPDSPEWKVCFDESFWGHRGKTRAGAEIRLDKQFYWAGRRWLIPAAYSCGKGLVLDLCMRVEAENIREFVKKWDLSPENDSCESFTHEQQMQMELDNPFSLSFASHLELNGKTMRPSRSCAVSFNPCFTDGCSEDAQAKWVIDHYGMDDSCGWMIYRISFPWAVWHRPGIRSLCLGMEQLPRCVPGPHFKVHAPGDSFSFSHPAGGAEYTLTVQSLERQTLSQDCFATDRRIYPTHFVIMSYTLSPGPGRDISVRDSDEGDRPVEIIQDAVPYAPEARNDIACIGVICGADSPAAPGEIPQDSLHTACSALHFEPVEEDVEWRVEFSIRQSEAVKITLV